MAKNWEQANFRSLLHNLATASRGIKVQIQIQREKSYMNFCPQILKFLYAKALLYGRLAWTTGPLTRLNLTATKEGED